MNITEMRAAYREALLSREKKNQYSQAENKRFQVESGWGDCSSTPYYWLKKLFGLNIGDYTGAQIESPLGQVVDLDIRGGVPDESQMEIGDHLYFRGNDADRPQGVGHVEIYIGNGQCFGHGSGLGGTVKDMESYCAKRQATASKSSKLKNKGLICVIRYLHDDSPIQSDQDYVTSLYRDLLGRDPDAGGLADWVGQLQGGMTREDVRQGFFASEEYRSKHPEPDTPIMAYQRWLNGYLGGYLTEPLDIDGRCGPKTRRAAVMAMQVYLNHACGAGLVVDGSFGAKSKAAYASVRRGCKGDNVRIVQGLLYGRGYDPNGFDGSCGPGCEAAIRQYQSDTDDFEVDGHCGKRTFAALTR